MKTLTSLHPDDRGRVIAVYAAQIGVVLADPASRLIAYSVFRSSDSPGIAIHIVKGTIEVCMMIAAVLIPLGFSLSFRKRSPVVALHALQCLYLQIASNLFHCLIALPASILMCVVTLYGMTQFESKVIVDMAYATLALSIAIRVAVLALLVQGLACAVKFKSAEIPFIGRLARAITLGLPIPQPR
jgi:hypothetical protein